MGCSRRFWPNQSTFLPSFHWECRRLKNEICALQRKEKAESFVWKSNLEAKRQKWQDQRAASTDFSLKIQFLMQRRIWAGSKWTAGGCTFAKYHKDNYLKGSKRSSQGWKEGRVEIGDLFSPLSEKNFPLCGADHGRRMEGDEYLMLFSPDRLQMFLKRGVAVSLFQIFFQ